MFFLLLHLSAAAPAGANFLTYIDDNGTKHVVQSADEIPARFRNGTNTSAAGDAKNSFFRPDREFTPTPGDSPGASCYKEANFNFDSVKKKLFNKEDGSLSAEELRDYGALLNQREQAKAGCAAKFPEEVKK